MLLLLLTVYVVPVFAETGHVQKVTVITVNDFHGMIEEQGKNAGLSKLAGYIKQVRETEPNTVVLSAGDMFQGSVDSNLLYGKTVIDAMNDIGFDAMAAGNHEFDWGLDRLEQMSRSFQFPLLAANVTTAKTGQYLSFCRPYTLIEREGIKIGIIGLATPETAYKTNPRFVGGLQFADPALIVPPLVRELKGRGANIIIVLSHLGCNQDETSGIISGEAAGLASAVTGIDLIVAGHSHAKVAGQVNGVPVVQAKSWGRALGRVELTYDPGSGKVIGAEAAVIDLNARALQEDAAVAAIVARDRLLVEPIKQEVLGQNFAALSHDRFQLSPLGEWVTDILRRESGADIALQNGGGLRSELLAGPVTKGRLYEILPFDNTLYTMELTGAEIWQILEYGLGANKVGTLQFSGVLVDYGLAEQKITQIRTLHGAPLEKDRLYKVAVNDFLASGGDGFSLLKQGRNPRDTCIPLRDIIERTVLKQKTIRFAPDKRLTISALSPGRQVLAA